MEKQLANLTLFNFSHPLMNTEWLALLGDKYQNSLPFKFEFVAEPQHAQVIVWDGIITIKNRAIVERFLKEEFGPKILLLTGESMTLAETNELVVKVNTENIQFVELHGWNVIPEEILGALHTCYQKLNHV